MEKASNNISNAWIYGCSILTCGIISSAYLNGISNLALIHMKFRYKIENSLENSIDFSDKIKNENKMISYYWNHYRIVFMMGLTGLTIGALHLNKKN